MDKFFDDGFSKMLELVQRVDSEISQPLQEVLKSFTQTMRNSARVNRDYDYTNKATGISVNLMFMPETVYYQYSNKSKEYDIELFIKKLYKEDIIDGFVYDDSEDEEIEDAEEEDSDVDCFFSLTITTKNNVGVDWAFHIREDEDGYILISTKTLVSQTIYQKNVLMDYEDLVDYAIEDERVDYENELDEQENEYYESDDATEY